MAGGVRTGILCYMQRRSTVWFTPGEIQHALKYGRSGIQNILKKFEKEGLVERWRWPSDSLPPSIASLPPTDVKTDSRRTVSKLHRGEKPYRITEPGGRLCSLMKAIEKIGLPVVPQNNPLTKDAQFMAKLKADGFNEKDIENAETAGILHHRRIKIEQEFHETTFGAIERPIADAFQPQVRRIQVVIRHRYRIS